MKKLIILALVIFSFSFVNAQNIISISPNGETIQEWDASHVRVDFKATIENPNSNYYAVVFTIDPDGNQKVLKGKNKNFTAGFLDGFVSEFELTLILDGIKEGPHTLRVDVYERGLKIVDSQETTFTIDYIN